MYATTIYVFCNISNYNISVLTTKVILPFNFFYKILPIKTTTKAGFLDSPFIPNISPPFSAFPLFKQKFLISQHSLDWESWAHYEGAFRLRLKLRKLTPGRALHIKNPMHICLSPPDFFQKLSRLNRRVFQ